MLVGTSEFDSRREVASGLTFENASKTSAVPELEAKIGGKYSHQLAQGVLTIDAGWMMTNYFNTISSIHVADDSDFAVQGPYAGLKWLGNLA